jgi:predicted phosphodiesterase
MSENGPAIVVADMHLGLLPGRRLLFFHTYGRSDSVSFASFLSWLSKLNENSAELPRGDWGNPIELVKPSYLILLGDYFELWDAHVRAIEMSAPTVWNHMEKLDCKKVHVIGNHDFGYDQVKSFSYPQGKSTIEVVSGPFPEKNEWLGVGGSWFIFLHGHEFISRKVGRHLLYFGRLIPLSKVLSQLRDVAEGIGEWSWWLLGLGIGLPLLSWLLGLVGDWRTIALSASSLLIVAGLPRLIITGARPLWNSAFKSKYEPRQALVGFAGWWKHTMEKTRLPLGRKYVVFGHTHLTDIYTSKEIVDQVSASIKLPEDLTLVNIPSWTSDRHGEYQKIFRDAFLYANGDVHLIGWDWKALKPFYIPEAVARTIAIGSPIDETTATRLAAIGWPPELLEKLRQPIRLLASKHPFAKTRSASLQA